MRKILVSFFLLLCFVGYTNSQTPDYCRFIVNKTDEFTGEKILVTTPAALNKPATEKHRFTVAFANVIDRDNLLPPSKFVTIKLTSVNESLFIARGEPLLIKLNNNEIVELIAMDDYRTETKPTKPGVTLTQVVANYQASNDVLVKIQRVGIASIRMNTSHSQFDMNMKTQDNKKLAQLLTCVVDV
ncbi:hypothetical protein [Dysgonomonas sp. 520]|uniref:hypothetical protein n=1 Tax=Dysgonomonas sp. 520 TaxID=2302931 RepID=UPI0013D74698|nr:hypothetical protein [Dysgonomonas sp. 520]NDW10146.1 hypothetical protein [Dysgonomonas sp. 520]